MVVSQALLSLLRATDVGICQQLRDLCIISCNKSNDDTSGIPGDSSEHNSGDSDVHDSLGDAFGAARAVLAEETVLLVILRAFERYHADAWVVAASCVLMREGLTHARQVNIRGHPLRIALLLLYSLTYVYVCVFDGIGTRW